MPPNPNPSSPPAAVHTPYPTPTRTASSLINSTPTTATAIYFTDKILITITQSGGISQWFHVPLPPPSPFPTTAHHHHHDDSESGEPPLDLLPLAHLTPTTLLGGGGTEREALGQLYAVQIATAVRMRDEGEERTVVVGLGLGMGMGAGGRGGEGGTGRDEFFEMLELVGRVL